MGKQTVEEGIFSEDGRRIKAVELISFSEEDLTSFRRQLMMNRVNVKKGISKPLLLCAYCGMQLYLSRQHKEEGNRWFTHSGKAFGCPWYEGKKLAPDKIMALRYRGEQESDLHKDLKNFIADWLEQDSSTEGKVYRDVITLGQCLKGEWKRPDVRFEWQGKKIVFEIQLSYLFLSEVLKRENFYRAENTYLIWIFNYFDLNRSTQIDEFFDNKRNIFILDKAAIEQTEKQKSLMFKCIYHKPNIKYSKLIEDRLESSFISLNDLVFPDNYNKPYYFDYEQHLHTLNEGILIATKIKLENARKEYLEAAKFYYENDHKNEDEILLQKTVGMLAKLGFPEAKQTEFWGWHQVLPKLLSIQYGTPIGFKFDKIYSVFNLFININNDKEYPYVQFYLSAYKTYKPKNLNEDQRIKIKNFRKSVWESLENNEDKYLRKEKYTRLISFLFPEMRQILNELPREHAIDF